MLNSVSRKKGTQWGTRELNNKKISKMKIQNQNLAQPKLIE